MILRFFRSFPPSGWRVTLPENCDQERISTNGQHPTDSCAWPLKDETTEVFILANFLKSLVHVSGVDDHFCRTNLGRFEIQFVQ